MGQDVTVAGPRPIEDALAALTAAGQPCQVLMVDGGLVMPTAPLPARWTEVRLRGRAGMLTLRRSASGDLTIVVFGNAAPELLALRDQLASALAP